MTERRNYGSISGEETNYNYPVYPADRTTTFPAIGMTSREHPNSFPLPNLAETDAPQIKRIPGILEKAASVPKPQFVEETPTQPDIPVVKMTPERLAELRSKNFIGESPYDTVSTDRILRKPPQQIDQFVFPAQAISETTPSEDDGLANILESIRHIASDSPVHTFGHQDYKYVSRVQNSLREILESLPGDEQFDQLRDKIIDLRNAVHAEGDAIFHQKLGDVMRATEKLLGK